MNSPSHPSDESGGADTPRKQARTRSSLEIARGVLESLKYELSQGGAVDAATVSDMEARLKELEDQRDATRIL